MSKEQFDHIENKIREAAANNEPAFEEQAWDKMEAKLNKENDKRRGIFLWLPISLLLIATAGGLVLLHNRAEQKISVSANAPTINATKQRQSLSTDNDQINNDQSAARSAAITKTAIVDTNKIDEQNNSLTTADNNKADKQFSSSASTRANSNNNNQRSFIATKSIHVAQNNTDESISNTVGRKENTATISSNKKIAKRNKKAGNDDLIAAQSEVVYTSSQKIKRNTNSKTNTRIKAGAQADADANEAPDAENEETDQAIAGKQKITISTTADQIDQDKKKDSLQKIIKKDTVAIKAVADSVIKKDIKPKKNNWYLLASIGADASGATLLSFNNSTITPRAGVGIGYQINKRFSVQTGFYAGRKKYIAGPNDYHSKDDTYLTTVNISKVSANCLIFEIPITIRYNFLLKPKTTYYATVGLSSFIMKNEAYDYYFTASGIAYEASHSYTGNKNLFSIATLSVGIERKLSKAFSIQAEPSINIPIAGVGEGTVKLYSTDLQVGVKYNFHW
ncbi:MAG TPA: outer membrane beta-barrel protein [Ferruginibacter sp.]|nr:outer membrane beta-barrel protein [Ferruginibacter sp.]